MLWQYIALYVVCGICTAAAAYALAKRASDPYSRQAFIFAFSTAWPLAWALALSLILLVIVASLYLLATWPVRRAAARRNATP